MHKDREKGLKYSFIIPLYNEEMDILETVNHCLQQKSDNFLYEIVLIDDCSIDGTYELCKNTYGNCEKIILLRNEANKGVAYSRNYGVKNSTGDIVIFLNADELVDENFLLSINKLYINGADYVFPQSRVENVATSAYGRFRDCYRLYKYDRPNKFMWSQGFSCRRSLFYEVNGFNEKYPGCGGEDWDFVSRIDRLHKNRVVDIDIIVYHKVPTIFFNVVWHMYNRGRGSSNYDLLYLNRNPKKMVIIAFIKYLFWLTIAVWNLKVFFFVLALSVLKTLIDAYKFAKSYEKTDIYIGCYYLLDKIIRKIGYGVNIWKHCLHS